MNAKVLLSWLGTVTALVLSLTLWFQLCEVWEEGRKLKAAWEATRSRLPRSVRAEEQVDLEDVMEKFQRYANKLYFAGQHDHWPLADFYVDELEELAKYVSWNKVKLGPVDISRLMQGILLPPVERLTDIAWAKDQEGFIRGYRALTAACNQCHEATSHGFIVIEEPRTPALDNQRYGVPEVIPTGAGGRRQSGG